MPGEKFGSFSMKTASVQSLKDSVNSITFTVGPGIGYNNVRVCASSKLFATERISPLRLHS